MAVQMLHGARLGRLEESFLTRLNPGECFLLAGRALELVKIEQMTAYVRRAPPGRATVPRRSGTRMALSSVLAGAMLEQLALAAQGQYPSPELQALQPLLELQGRWSALPTPGTLLAETLRTREGWHLFVYPFAGRQVHTGLASLWAWRAAQGAPGTFSIAVNDHGLELLNFYKAYRALVRAKVALFSMPADADGLQRAAALRTYRNYANLAESYSAIPSLFMAITSGVSAKMGMAPATGSSRWRVKAGA